MKKHPIQSVCNAALQSSKDRELETALLLPYQLHLGTEAH